MADGPHRSNGELKTLADSPRRAAILFAGLATGLLLFYASQFIDLFLYRRNIPSVTTVMDNVIIGGLGGLLLVLYVSGFCAIQRREHEEERLLLAAELNHHKRNAPTVILYSAELPRAVQTEEAVPDKPGPKVVFVSKESQARAPDSGLRCSSIYHFTVAARPVSVEVGNHVNDYAVSKNCDVQPVAQMVIEAALDYGAEASKIPSHFNLSEHAIDHWLTFYGPSQKSP
jgi:hypothetical protein